LRAARGACARAPHPRNNVTPRLLLRQRHGDIVKTGMT